MSQRQGKFRCPECQAAIDLPEGNRFDRLPISFFHNSLLSLLAVRQSGDTSSITCSQCRKTNPQMYYCFDCGRFMCLDCFNSHQMLSATFGGHKVTPVKDFKGEDYEALLKRQPFCSQQFHEKEITRFFRSQCQVCICQFALSRIIKTTTPFCLTKQHTTKRKTSCLVLRSSRKKKPTLSSHQRVRRNDL